MEFGYLELPYLVYPYLTPYVEQSYGFQVQAIIEDAKEIATQAQNIISANSPYGFQALGNITSGSNSNGCQSQATISSDFNLACQIYSAIGGQTSYGFQAQGEINSGIYSKAWQVRSDKYPHNTREIYLIQPYLVYPYLAAGYNLILPTQANAFVREEFEVGNQAQGVVASSKSIGFQVLGVIESSRAIGTQAYELIGAFKDVGTQSQGVIAGSKSTAMQAQGIIQALTAKGFQINSVAAKSAAFQVRSVLYNTNNLRILCDFASRGTTGLNWISNNTAAGDFDVNNLNTDIVEQVFRSNDVLSTVVITCDTEISQGVAVDTLAILNHNFSRSVTLNLQSSNVSNFATIGEDINLLWANENIYYIAPELPMNQYRYWRLSITDLSNPDGFVQIGTIVFGAANIMQGEGITDEISFTRKHFADKVQTEGYTNVSNDRALKRVLGIKFINLDFNKGNYGILQEVFEEDRTSLKCLWIPTPRYPNRYAVFAKLAQIPEETHNSKSELLTYISLDVELDESL